MPSIKLPSGVKSQEVKSGFEAYDGPIPTQRGFYRAIIRSMKWGKNKGGSYGFTIVADLAAANGDPKNHAQFDGFTMFSHSIITETSDGSALKEGSVNNLSNLYFALDAKDDPNIVVAKGDADEEKLDVLKFDGKTPIGRAINIDMGFEDYNGENRPTISGIFKFKEEASAGKKSRAVVADEDGEDEDEIEEEDLQEDDEEYAAREEELNSLKLAEVKAIAKELKVTGANKAAIIEAILDAEFPEDGAAVLDEDEEEDDEVEEIEEVEDEEEDDEEEDDEEEEDEDDEALQERSEELANFDRAALKKVVKEVAPDFTVLKRHSDEDIREAILAAEFGEDETPF